MAKCFKAQILYKKMECIGLLEEKVTRVFVFFFSGWSFARWPPGYDDSGTGGRDGRDSN